MARRMKLLLLDRTAQANTGTDVNLSVPSWVKTATLIARVTAVAGTTPIFQIRFTQDVPGRDGVAQTIGLSDSLTAAGDVVLVIGSAPALAGTNYDSVGGQVSRYLKGGSVLDRTTGDETYTYKLWVEYTD